MGTSEHSGPDNDLQKTHISSPYPLAGRSLVIVGVHPHKGRRALSPPQTHGSAIAPLAERCRHGPLPVISRASSTGGDCADE